MSEITIPLGDVALLYRRLRRAKLPHRETVWAIATHYAITDEQAAELVRHAKADGLIQEDDRAKR